MKSLIIILTKAAEIANAYDFIMKLEDKYDTIIGERVLNSQEVRDKEYVLQEQSIKIPNTNI